MSLEIEDTLESVSKRKVPEEWMRSGFLSQSSLEGYIDRLVRRVQFYNTWLAEGLKPSLWLPGFFNHHSFISALKQNFARKQGCSVDEVGFRFRVLDQDVKVEDGSYGVEGLHLEGARWCQDTKRLQESHPKVQYSSLPTIQLTPTKISEDDPEHQGYKCPVYVTQVNILTVQT